MWGTEPTSEYFVNSSLPSYHSSCMILAATRGSHYSQLSHRYNITQPCLGPGHDSKAKPPGSHAAISGRLSLQRPNLNSCLSRGITLLEKERSRVSCCGSNLLTSSFHLKSGSITASLQRQHVFTAGLPADTSHTPTPNDCCSSATVLEPGSHFAQQNA